MAFNKNKVIALAQKYIQKGQLDRAIKEYEKLLEEDKKDIRTRLKIGDLYAKKGDNQEAARVYQEVAESYAKDGFYLKAVAVYKNILKLAPDLIDVNIKLGDLYHQLSLLGDAMSQYQIVVNYYDKHGMVKESLDTLKKMVELDPENITFKINLAELYHKEGHVSQAQAEFETIARDLKDAGNLEELTKVYERILHHNPDQMDATKDLAECYLKQNLAQKALAKLQVCFKAEPKDPRTLELLAQSFLQLQQPKKAKSVFKELVQIYEASGDADNKARVQQELGGIAPEEGGSVVEDFSEPEVAPEPTATSASVSAPIAPPPPPPAASLPPEVKSYDEEVTQFTMHTGGDLLDPLGTDVAPPPSPMDGPPIDFSESTATSVAAKAPPPEAIVDLSADAVEDDFEEIEEAVSKLMTETEVYLKYGLNDKAKEHLDLILTKNPKHEDARVKLKDLFLSMNDKASAIVQLKELVVVATASQTPRLQKYVTELAQLSPGDAAPSAAPAEVAMDIGELNIEAEAVIPANDEALVPESLLEVSADLKAEPAPQEMELDLGIEIDIPMEDEPAAAEPMAEISEDLSEDLSLDSIEEPSSEEPQEFEVDPNVITIPPTEEVAVEDLSAADLGLDDEQEIAVEEEPEPLADTQPPQPVPVAPKPVTPPPAPASPPPEMEMRDEEQEVPLEVREELDEAEFFVQQGLQEEARKIYEDLIARYPGNAKVKAEVQGKLAHVANLPPDANVKVAISEPPATPAQRSSLVEEIEEAVGPEAVEFSPKPAHGVMTITEDTQETASDDDSMFDLAAELSEELKGYEEKAQPQAAVAEEQVDFREVFEEFKKGVAKQLGKEDSETHFDLGLAYKEMQLHDDAINEFQIAMSDSKKVVECYTMIGLCFMDKGEFDKASEYFKQGLAWKSINTQEIIGLNYELGIAQMSAGHTAEALASFQRVQKLKPDFRDVGEKVSSLQNQDAAAPSAPAEEGFDLGADLARDDEELVPIPVKKPTKAAPAAKKKPEPSEEVELTDMSAFDTPSEKGPKAPAAPKEDAEPSPKPLKKPTRSEKSKSKISYV